MPNLFGPGLYYEEVFFEDEGGYGPEEWKKQGVHFPRGMPYKLYSIAEIRQMLKDGVVYHRIPGLVGWEKEYSPEAVLVQAWIKIWPVKRRDIKVVVERRGKHPCVIWVTEEGHKKIAEWVDGTPGEELPPDSLENDRRLLGKVTAFGRDRGKLLERVKVRGKMKKQSWASFKEFWVKFKK